MNSSESSNDLDKSWDHPWTTQEMRQHKNEWSLAADVGLLKHLQQFSDNLTGQTHKIQEHLNSLSLELDGTLAIIDNITNASLALANTQFIESRVSEDDVEIKQVKDIENQKENNEELQKEDLIAGVSEIKAGLNIMDELFQRLEVDASDSEDEGELPTTSIVLKPNDPYQQRPLPYVIGSDKWKASNGVGLELSSSDDEQQEGDDTSLSQDLDDNLQVPMNNNNPDKSLSPSCPSSPSLSSDHNQRDSIIKQYSGISSRTDKLEARSQDTLNSFSEIATPTVVQSKEANSSKAAPSFAEELAKRLGNVTDKRESIDQASINQSKDDLFAPDDEAIFGAKSENPFGNIDDLFVKDVSSSLWKDKPIKVPKTNILPPSLDVPPPMNAEVDEPKSAFDDLYGDADSENSDNIFAPKSSVKTRSPSLIVSSDQRDNEGAKENNFLKIVQSDKASHIITSTPENHDDGDNLFGDGDGDDDDDIFGTSVKSQSRATNRSPEIIRNANIRKPPGLAITQNDIFSSNLGSRLFQRETLWKFSDSTETESSAQHEDAQGNEPIISDRIQQRDASNQNKSEPSSIIAGNADRSASNVDDSDSSGISIRPNSINNASSYGVDFQPQSESTRLRSEEIYREGVTGDSLFGARARQPDISNSINNSSNQPREGRLPRALDSYPEEDFDSDDVFGASNLLKADSKSKSKLTSSDDLFSNISSGSRLQNSSDLLAATVPQYTEKSTPGHNRGLFDEDIDIFGAGDAPDVDIFGEGFKATLKPKEIKKPSLKFQESASASLTKKTPDLFFAATSDPVESAVSQSSLTKSIFKSDSIFDDSEEEDDDALFGSSFLKSNRKSTAMPTSQDDNNLFADSSKSSGPMVATTTKKDSTTAVARVDGAKKSTIKSEEKWDSDGAAIESALPSYRTGGLFDNLDDDDDDSLFESKKTNVLKEILIKTKDNTKSSTASESAKEKIDDSIFTLNSTKIEGLLEDQSFSDDRAHKIDDKEFESAKESVSDTDKSMNKKISVFSSEKMDAKMSEKISKCEIEEEISSTDGAKISKSHNSSETTGESTKREPPKSLSIRLPMPVPNDDSTQAPRRAVSGKIKNLMGKMGDLKILSPTDTPPLWRRAEEKSDTEEKPTDSKDTKDGSFFSLPSTQSPPVIANDNENLDIFTEPSKEVAPGSPLDDSGNSETAVSFDVPAQVETLAVTASKSRAKIRAKRRPQSRHARQSALRKSGIDFDTVDTSEPEGSESIPSDVVLDFADQILTVTSDSIDSSKPSSDFDRLSAPHIDTGRSAADKNTESTSSLAPDDRSEMSLSKGSSISMNKNTLLSPSTDEEDLFDVPPDLPEDPPKEDTLFGRAPILSPIDGSLISGHARVKNKFKDNRGHATSSKSNDDDVVKSIKVEKPLKETSKEGASGVSDDTGPAGMSKLHSDIAEDTDKYTVTEVRSSTQKATDPLRDSNHDPLKDPSQLFAFVTKTPSPEKGQNLLFKEDDSLFTQVAKKSAEEAKAASKKPAVDLFADDSGGDLFSGTLAKPPKISMKSNKPRSLFDDMDADEDGANDLFGSVSRAKTVTEKAEATDDMVSSKSSDTSGKPSSSRSSLHADDTEDDLFVDAIDKTFTPDTETGVLDDPEDRLFSETRKVAKDAKLKDIFGDQSSGEDSIFATKKTIGTGKSGASNSIFSADTDDEDINDIFGKKASTKTTKIQPIENRTTVKKPVTRDLKKTAEKIVEDPLSMLQND